jgi:hypothetical protein
MPEKQEYYSPVKRPASKKKNLAFQYLARQRSYLKPVITVPVDTSKKKSQYRQIRQYYKEKWCIHSETFIEPDFLK